MNAPKDQRSFYIRAFEHEGYWTIKIAVDSYDHQGTPDEVLTLRENVKCPRTDDHVDQTWVLLVQTLHILEANGAMGRIAGADWPALPVK